MVEAVYRKTEKSINSCDKFELEGSLCSDNRWVMMATKNIQKKSEKKLSKNCQAEKAKKKSQIKSHQTTITIH